MKSHTITLKLWAVSPYPSIVRWDGQETAHSICIVSLVVALFLCLTGPAWAVSPNAEELGAAQRWSSVHLGGDPAALPFSFTFGGRPSNELLKRWPLEQSTKRLDERRTRHTLTFADPQSKVEVRCEAIEYLDYPTVEWTLYFRNMGEADSPILKDIQALDAIWERDPESEFLLHHAVGSPANGSDYGPLETPLRPGAVKRISAAGGRPTNSDLSYFNLQWGSQGLAVRVLNPTNEPIDGIRLQETAHTAKTVPWRPGRGIL